MKFFQVMPLTIEIDDSKLKVVIRLFRAVSTLELDDVRKTGEFRDSPHKSGEKPFFFTLQCAEKLAEWLPSTDGLAYSIVFADAPAHVIEGGRAHMAASEGPGVYLPASDLHELKAVQEVDL